MEIHGDLGYLTIPQQITTGYSSPIRILEFDIHGEREKADANIDRIEALQGSDDITEGRYASELHRARVRSMIARSIGKELAMRSAVIELLNDVEHLGDAQG